MRVRNLRNCSKLSASKDFSSLSFGEGWGEASSEGKGVKSLIEQRWNRKATSKNDRKYKYSEISISRMEECHLFFRPVSLLSPGSISRRLSPINKIPYLLILGQDLNASVQKFRGEIRWWRNRIFAKA